MSNRTPDPFRAALGEFLREKRKLARKNQTQAASHIDMTQPSLSDIEKGFCAIAFVDLHQLLFFYGVEAESWTKELSSLRKTVMAAHPDLYPNGRPIAKPRGRHSRRKTGPDISQNEDTTHAED
jgi:transcriptional regulator with XRE-family HTH domain